jgi:hypothetical protein
LVAQKTCIKVNSHLYLGAALSGHKPRHSLICINGEHPNE